MISLTTSGPRYGPLLAAPDSPVRPKVGVASSVKSVPPVDLRVQPDAHAVGTGAEIDVFAVAAGHARGVRRQEHLVAELAQGERLVAAGSPALPKSAVSVNTR